MRYIDIIKRMLVITERTPAWLSRKLGVSHTIVHSWLGGKRSFNHDNFCLCMDIFLETEHKTSEDIDEILDSLEQNGVVFTQIATA